MVRTLPFPGRGIKILHAMQCGGKKTKLSNVLVNLGCYNIIPSNQWFINNRNIFFTVLESRSLTSRC